MSRLKGAGLLAAGLAAGALLVPTGALSAAPSLVGITDNSGTRVATVTKANQLLAAESDPRNAVILRQEIIPGECAPLYTVPKGKALVIKTGVFNTEASASTGAEYVPIYAGPYCATDSAPVVAEAIWASNPTSYQTIDEDFGSQVVVPQNTEIDFQMQGASGATAIVALYGYLIPAAAAPAAVRIVGNTKPLKLHTH